MNQNVSAYWSSQLLYLLTNSPATREHIHLLFITNYIHFHLKLWKFINTLNFTEKKSQLTESSKNLLEICV